MPDEVKPLTLREWLDRIDGKFRGPRTSARLTWEARQPEIDALTARVDSSEFLLRSEWWLNHGCSISALYGDDGEMQCGRHMLDFKREPIGALGTRVMNLRVQRAAEALTATRKEPE